MMYMLSMRSWFQFIQNKAGILRLVVLLCFSLALAACSGDTCMPLKCPETNVNCKQPFPKISYTPPSPSGAKEEKLGTISYIVRVIQDQVLTSSQKIFEKITEDSNYKNLVTAMMTLFVAFYGITIALGMAQPSPFELVIRVSKMAVIFFMLTSWSNFQEIVVDFFEGLTTDLTTILSSAIINSATEGNSANVDVSANDVFNFVDDKVIGVVLSVRFAVIVGALTTIGTVGVPLALMLFSTILAYLWTIVVAVQIYVMAAIARALLYAVAPIFIVFLLFNQTKSLFDGWIKQLINFSLQPILLVSFLAFFNGLFFNYLDNMFKPGYFVCFSASTTTGQTFKLHTWRIVKDSKDVDITEAMDVFDLFIVLMLAMMMTKMNQWAVQAASQLSEGGLNFAQAGAAFGDTQRKITESFSKSARDAFNLPGNKK